MMIKISGLQKTTLLDYPGHVAATVFLGGCNFRCPFCHNSDLITGPIPEAFAEDEVLSFLKKRVGILEGVCITGGEPTLQDGLTEFIKKIKTLGLLVKLDTNGYRPDILKDLCNQGLIDYVAMDIKSGKSGYAKTAGCAGLQLSLIDESIRFLIDGNLSFEFRTTVVKELHTTEDFKEIGPWIAGAARYYLQSYKDSGNVLVPEFSACDKETLSSFAGLAAPYVGEVSLRGTDY